MFCKECGHEINNKAIMCVHCGSATKEDFKNETNNQTIVNVNGTTMTPKSQNSSYATAALWLGICTFLLCGLPGPLALIFGIMGINDIHQNPEKTGMGGAIFATIIGGITSLCLIIGLCTPTP